MFSHVQQGGQAGNHYQAWGYRVPVPPVSSPSSRQKVFLSVWVAGIRVGCRWVGRSGGGRG